MEDLNLVRKLAWSFNQMTGIDYDELFSEACLGYAEAKQVYDPDRGAEFSTFAWSCVRNKLRLFVRNERQYANQTPITTLCPDSILTNDFMDHLSYLLHEERNSFEDLLSKMPRNARHIAETIIQRQEELPDDIPPYYLRRTIREMLHEEGLSWKKIFAGIRDLKVILNHT